MPSWNLAALRASARVRPRLGPAAVAALAAACLTATLLVLPSPGAQARPATGGVGTFGGSIDWVEWGTNGQILPGSGFTGTSTRSISGAELVVSCRASNIAGGTIEAYRPGNWRGDAMDEMYNIGGGGGNNQLINAVANRANGSGVAFDFACSASLDGAPVPLAGIVFGDAEQSDNVEFVAATAPAGATFRIIDRYRSPGCGSSTPATLQSATNRLLLSGATLCGSGPAAVGFIEGATSARVELKGRGKSAIALGAVIATDHGDAPESYGDAAHLVEYTFTGGELQPDTLTLVHNPSFQLGTATTEHRLGATVDPEGGAAFSDDALGDSSTGSAAFGPADDEDGLLSATSITGAVGEPFSARVACNTTGDPVAGWVDWNVDGDFDDGGERSETAVCAGSGADTTITWSQIPLGVVGQLAGSTTFMRIRTALDASDIESPTGVARSGEVEDYAMTLDLGTTLQVTKEVLERADPADQFRVGIATTDGTGVADVSTSGTDTSATTGPRIVQDGVAYQVTEIIADGDTPLAAYNSTIACRNTTADTDVVATGDRPPWTLPPQALDTAVECTVSNVPFRPAIALEKTATLVDADGDDLADVGERVRYDFVLTNTGDVLLTDVGVEDPTAGEVTCVDTTLAAGAGTTCTSVVSHEVSQDEVDAGEVTNTATAVAVGPAGERVESEPDTETVPTDDRLALILEKTPTLGDTNGNDAADAGERITYSFTVTNDGQRTLTEVAVTDPALGEVTCSPTTLGAGAVATCSASTERLVTQADVDAGDPLTNTATATANGPDGTRVSDEDAASVPTAPAAPAVDLTKIAGFSDEDGDGRLDVGESIAYSFRVENTGNVTLESLEVSDPGLGGVTCPVSELAPGEATLCTADTPRAVTQADVDAGTVSNTATATATAPDGSPVQDTDSVEVPGEQTPGLVFDKTATLEDGDDDGVADAGEVVTYGFTVTNTGNVTLDEVGVTDSALGQVTCDPATLSPGEQARCTGPARLVSQADVDAGIVSNTASATATAPEGARLSVEDTASVPTAPAAPAVDLTKIAALSDEDGDASLDVGESIAYSFRVENTGNVTLESLEVSDPGLGGVTCPVSELAPGEATLCTADTPRAVTQADVDAGTVSNTATATATAPDGSPVQDTDSVELPGEQTPGLVLDKTAVPQDGDGVADAGEVVTYGFTVTNTGNVTLTEVAVTDPTLGEVTCDPTTLSPGEQARCTGPTRTVSQADVDAGDPLTNTATATGNGPEGTQVSDEDTADLPVAPAVAGLTLDKSAALRGDDRLDAGDIIDYRFEVTNTGNVTMSELSLQDALLEAAGDDVVCPAATLAPGETTVCTAAYEVTTADSDRGSVSNTATSVAQSPAQDVIVSEPDTAVLESRPDPAQQVLASTGALLPWLAAGGALLIFTGVVLAVRRRPTTT